VNDQNKYLTANFVKQYDLFQYIQYSKIFSGEIKILIFRSFNCVKISRT